MKIAIAGKGGVGKTTLSGVMARYLADEGYTVLTIDADPDANLASALGFPAELLKGVTPLAEMTPLVEERTGAKKGTFSGVFRLNPKVDDIPDTYSVTHHGVKLLIVGNIPQAEGGCFCPENVLLKGLLHHILVKRDEVVIIDMEAGLEHLTRGSTKYVDAFIIVVEPGQRSIATAHQILRLARDLGVQKVYGVGNKVTSPEDRALIETGLNELLFLGHLSFNQQVIEADKQGMSPYDLNGTIKKELKTIIDRLRGEAFA
ncbi:MAG: carbon monoxide dehydrogenase [Deltaproteobacteria bacterium RBG_16_54_18]|nr:MAG: carbon monoxide dehydrogenase [Deltaproteobacteria bacterium RBG_16_54_18]